MTSHARGARTADYDFHLPESLIAQRPTERRDASRLLVVHRESGRIEHRHFRDLIEYVAPGDALVVNATRVMRARLLGTRDSGAPGEVFLLRPLGEARWEAMVHPGGKLKPGRVLHVGPGFDVEILEVTERRTRVVRLLTGDLPAEEAIERFGHVPLPPYVHRADEPTDEERYQTVYARERGSVAAPTAGLHFTPALLAALEAKGVRRAELVLHVGAGTFKPVEVDDPAAHVMHSEWFTISEAVAATIAAARASNHAVWAVGTTSCRALESAARADGTVAPGQAETSIFIRPPYAFRAVDRLITNFHLPRSTLVMLVAAFAGYDLTMRAYQEAIDAGYRFYSYGDAMAVV
ncbi:MAG: tRNA preQ1(34) S-adenosylmethionine ribosyltransferase-isomerase QueA [Gemmatimonadaceae bacterium]|nr:tRNA preQ1(34) S-adenosylmethionine ribosyltransferase-isomerase QueA [Gemmatimonadaceae bacterium]NUQ94419.1 tRNA preQ1(34) S-adenosylmethionine ribosyltransferase-isomerase QueA [Gemmatimonadaceae bacterium]NUR19459.1 tRNA preQ1(34) S-adenosylmethionine ribosyltransferase-isomerase QueA [Gemmatimonadaceae bacterium]NUS96228.1 tRNA preQ1(34) S-adenosylmethionine ribosyltransferase-isomerase QueA [Gemmatimonadaceae bacterium]